MTPADIGSGFNQALEEDENGSAWVIFPDVPIFQYPEFNGRFILPMILFSKLVSWLKPDWLKLSLVTMRSNGERAAPLQGLHRLRRPGSAARLAGAPARRPCVEGSWAI